MEICILAELHDRGWLPGLGWTTMSAVSCRFIPPFPFTKAKEHRMSCPKRPIRSSTSRREFPQNVRHGAFCAALLSAISARSFAAEDNTIKLALVGCGGRGTGAAVNALSTKGPTQLWAMADFFQNRLQSSFGALPADGQASGRAQGAAVRRPGRL